MNSDMDIALELSAAGRDVEVPKDRTLRRGRNGNDVAHLNLTEHRDRPKEDRA